LKFLPVSCLKLFRLSALFWFGSCSHCNFGLDHVVTAI
jgi:hypothetical protein